MKKSTCKKLLWIGVPLFIIFLMFAIFVFPNNNYEYGETPIMEILIGLVGIIGVFLVLIAGFMWNSEQRESERQELRQAQLEAIRRGKVNVEVKGKMRKLK